MKSVNDILRFLRNQPRWRLAVAMAAVLLGGWLLFRSAGRAGANTPTFAARRGPLEISILEGGSLKALESQEVKCEVRVGYQGAKILRIVDEGYLVTDDDVKTGKVLVELDSSDIQKQIVQQEIQYQTAVASLTEAQQNYEIQLNQNESDIKDALQKVRFARMDLDKYLGESITDVIIQLLGLDKLLAQATTNRVELVSLTETAPVRKPSTNGPTAPSMSARMVDQRPALAFPGVTNRSVAPSVASLPGMVSPDQPPPAPAEEPSTPTFVMPKSLYIDFSKYASIDVLGDGEAKQKLRKFEDDLQVSQKELSQAQANLEGTRRLFQKGFVTKTDLDRDELAYENSKLKVQTAETDRDLFLKFDFARSGEDYLSKYADAVRELDKTRRLAVSKLAQARAKLNSAQGQYQVQTRQRDDLQDQLAKCTMRAQKTGLVVYGSAGDDNFSFGNQEPIREGATVRERQAIITIPDMTRMAVNVKIHESYIKKVKKGQKARITVDAFPDKVLTGEVTMVGVLPDSQNRWLNPDLKVYRTTVTIDGTRDWVKPGMTAKVEILVDKLDDVVYVPVQSVSPTDGKQYCYVVHGAKPEQREVEIGEYNDNFIEIKRGLKPGELVMLHPPESTGNEIPGEEPGPKEGEKPAPAAPAAAAAPDKKS
jgi:HlyD family secretion protein